MNKNSIDENKAIQDGLERFLEQEIYEDTPSVQETLNGQQAPAPQLSEPIYHTQKSPEPIYHASRSPEPEYRTERIREEFREEEFYEEDSYEEESYEAVSERSRKKKNKKSKKGKKDAKKKKQQKRKKSKWKKFFATLIVLAVVFLVWWYNTVGKIYKEMNYEKTSGLASEPMKQDGVINVLLIGNDSRENGEDGRSDAMILLSVSNETKTIHMTSLLRDMYVEIPGHEGNRLNAAYAFGGPALLCETIEQNLGIEVNRYVLVNFQAFAALVDAVGGIDLEVTNEEVHWINAYLNEYNLLEGKEMTTDYLDASLSGEIHLNGPQALAYSRNRYIGTDFGRTERQRKVLNAVIKKLPVAFVTNQDELIEELFPNLTTNLTQGEVFSLSMSGGKVLQYEVVQTVIPAEGTYQNASIRGMSVLEVDFEANKEILRSALYEKEE